MNYCDWKRKTIAAKNYEKLRLFQFHALSALGSFVLGVAALIISVTQIISDGKEQETVSVEKRKITLESEIATASGMMRSTGFDQAAKP